MSRAAGPRHGALLAACLLLGACGGEGQDRGDVELRMLFDVDSLEQPESVAWDSARSRYLLTSVAGDPAARDGNGFVTSVSRDGGRVELRRFSSATPGLRLDAPRGIAVRGDRAWVADIQRVVGLDLRADTGLFARRIPGSRLLNDVAVGPDGTVYVSDTEGDAVYRVAADGSSHARIEAAGSLRSPNGLAVQRDGPGLLVAGWDGAILHLGEDGSVELVAEPRRARNLDGIQPDGGGGILFTDFSRGTLERLPPGGSTGTGEPVLWLEDLPSPADFLFRGDVLALPEMAAGRVRFYRVVRPDGSGGG